MKKCLIVFMAAMFLFVGNVAVMAEPITMPAQQSHQQSEMPVWLTEAGAQTVPDAELDKVQGENVILVFLYTRGIIYGEVALRLIRNWLYSIGKDPVSAQAKSSGRGILVNTINGWVPFEYVTTPAVIR